MFFFLFIDQTTATPASKAKSSDHSSQCGIDRTDNISPCEAETTDYAPIGIGKCIKSLGLN